MIWNPVRQLQTAAENGIPVVVFDSNVADTELVSAFRSTDNEKAGEMAAEKSGRLLMKRQVLQIFCTGKTASIQDRIAGFQKKIAESEGIEVAEIIYQDSVEDMEAAMKKHSNLIWREFTVQMPDISQILD